MSKEYLVQLGEIITDVRGDNCLAECYEDLDNDKIGDPNTPENLPLIYLLGNVKKYEHTIVTVRQTKETIEDRFYIWEIVT